MSRIYFHTQHAGTFEVKGMERHYLNSLTRNFANASIGLGVGDDPIKPTLVYKQGIPNFALKPYSGLGGDEERWGEMIDKVLALESDLLNVVARIAATCEIWGWVADRNRAWFADLLNRCRHVGLLRDEMGWEPLIEVLTRLTGVGDVVMSYSVTTQFPARWLFNADIGPGPRDARNQDADEKYADEWYALPTDEKWKRAFHWLQYEAPEQGFDIELKPENWKTWRAHD